MSALCCSSIASTRGYPDEMRRWFPLTAAGRVQVDKAASSGMIKNPGLAPPAPSDDWMSKL
jgi:hypothetical protein